MSASPRRVPKKYKLGPDIDLDREVVLDGAGERITKARAEAMAAYALKQVRRGRPSVTGREGRTPTLTVRVDPGTRAGLESIAAAEHKALSAIARDALAEYVQQHDRAKRRSGHVRVSAP